LIDSILFPNPLQPGRTERPQQSPQTGQTANSPFAKVLDQKMPAEAVRFSQHAQERLKARNINFSASDLANLEGAVMMGDAALVVSVKNRTVVTALDKQQMKGNVFTNIDSAVII